MKTYGDITVETVPKAQEQDWPFRVTDNQHRTQRVNMTRDEAEHVVSELSKQINIYDENRQPTVVPGQYYKDNTGDYLFVSGTAFTRSSPRFEVVAPVTGRMYDLPISFFQDKAEIVTNPETIAFLEKGREPEHYRNGDIITVHNMNGFHRIKVTDEQERTVVIDYGPFAVATIPYKNITIDTFVEDRSAIN